VIDSSNPTGVIAFNVSSRAKDFSPITLTCHCEIKKTYLGVEIATVSVLGDQSFGYAQKVRFYVDKYEIV